MWMLKYGTARMLPHHINHILVKAWDAFKVSSGKFLRGRFVKTKLRSLAPTDLTTNNQACAASVQVTSGSKYKEINEISCRTAAPIEVQKTRTNDPVIVLQSNGSQQSSRNIVF